MVLDFDREPLVSRVERRPLWHRPGLEHTIELKPEVVVQAPRGVLLHDKQQRSVAPAARLRRGLRRARELAFCGVLLQRALRHDSRYPLSVPRFKPASAAFSLRRSLIIAVTSAPTNTINPA